MHLMCTVNQKAGMLKFCGKEEAARDIYATYLAALLPFGRARVFTLVDLILPKGPKPAASGSRD